MNMNAIPKNSTNAKNSKSVAIIQSNYIPWKGYFDLIAAADVFVIYDDMQYTRSDWRNRNQIKTRTGMHWLTVPVVMKGRFLQNIRETEIHGTVWSKKHWRTINHNYSKSTYFNEVSDMLESSYMEDHYGSLSAFNTGLIKKICTYLNIKTVIRDSSEFIFSGDKSERVLSIAKSIEADRYITGPSAKAYLDTSIFEKANITVEWFDYSNYPSYPQAWGDFVHNVSIIDLLFHCGPNSKNYMKFCNN